MLLPLLALSALAATPAPALLLEGGLVYAAPDEPARRASILLRDGRIAFVGDADGRAGAQAGGARAIDLSGRFVFAGWADAHGHLEGLGEALEIADLRGAASARRKRRAGCPSPRRRCRRAPGPPGAAGTRTSGRDSSFPTRAIWTPRSPIGRPGRSAWTGTRSGSTRPRSRRPVIDRGDARPAGRPDHASRRRDALRRSRGRRGRPPAPRRSPRPRPPTANAGSSPRRVRARARASPRSRTRRVTDRSRSRPSSGWPAAAQLPIRVYATVSADEDLLAASFRRGVRIGRGSDFLTVRAIKVIADGALGSRGAALEADYSDEPGQRGLLVTPPERLDVLAREARQQRLAALDPRDRRPRQPVDPRRLREGRRRGPARGARRRSPADRARAGRRALRHPAVREGRRHRFDPADARHVRHAVGREARRPEANRRRVRVADASRRRARAWPEAATSRSSRRIRCSASTPP